MGGEEQVLTTVAESSGPYQHPLFGVEVGPIGRTPWVQKKGEGGGGGRGFTVYQHQLTAAIPQGKEWQWEKKIYSSTEKKKCGGRSPEGWLPKRMLGGDPLGKKVKEKKKTKHDCRLPLPSNKRREGEGGKGLFHAD